MIIVVIDLDFIGVSLSVESIYEYCNQFWYGLEIDYGQLLDIEDEKIWLREDNQ